MSEVLKPQEGEEQEEGGQEGAPQAFDVEAIASAAGWKPEAEWKPNPSRPEQQWQPAEAFLQGMPERFQALQRSNRAANEAARIQARQIEQIVEERAQERAQALARQAREAAEAGDGEAAARAVQEAASTRGPDPAIAQWVRERPWFTTDPEAKAVALAANQRAAESGASTQEQLAAAEAAVRKRFPEHFGQAAEADAPPVRTPPRSAPGGGLARPPVRVQTPQQQVAALTQEERNAGERLARMRQGTRYPFSWEAYAAEIARGKAAGEL